MFEAHIEQRRISAMSRQPPAQQAKAKSGADRKRGVRGKGTQIDPHGLSRKPKMPKVINLGNCVKLLWFTTF